MASSAEALTIGAKPSLPKGILTSHAHPHLFVFETLGEKIANTITHGTGAVLSWMALFFFMSNINETTSPLLAGCWIVYAISLIVTYTSSAMYHGLISIKWQKFFKTFDYIGIYLLIAGTYTPFATLIVGGWIGWGVFAFVWAGAIGGITFKLFNKAKHERIGVWIYMSLGWAGIVMAYPMIEVMDTTLLWLVLTGGLVYSAGVPFYLWHKLPYNHAIWHCFALCGSVIHFIAIYLATLNLA